MVDKKMYYVIFMGKVKEYDKWLSTFAKDASLIKSNGGRSARLLQNLEDPYMAMVITEWENLENAKKFAESDELKDRMQASGASNPEIHFLEEKLYIFNF
jgi:heme-degrading monooxygenase HmoA